MFCFRVFQYFNETAHRPESNLDVIEHQMALVREPSRVSQWCDGTSRRSSETNSLNTADSGEAVHRGYPSNVAGCRLSLDAGRNLRELSVRLTVDLKGI